jgi:hypothetical protein
MGGSMHGVSAVDREQVTIPPGHAWRRLPAVGAILGGLGLLASLLLRGADPAQFAHSWLVAFSFFLSLALGALFFVLLHHIANASWSTTVRRLAENVMGTLPLFALLFVPIAFGLHDLYHWTHEDAVAHDALLRGKAGFLNVPFFLVRAGGCFAIWALLAGWFLGRSRRQDETGDPALTRQMVTVSAPALIVFAITVTLAAVDWLMSLDPHWFSTIFGVYLFAGSLVGFTALIALLAAAARRAGLVADLITVEHFHDMGKLLFAFSVFWAYIAFSQYFLIWYGNIPEETAWFVRRGAGSWKTVSMLLGFGHFAVPFLYLMSRTIKRRTPLLAVGAVWMLLMHWLDLYWLVMPNLRHDGPRLSLLDLTTMVAVGGAFLAVLGLRMRGHALLPVRDPRLAKSLSFENV